MLAKYLLLIGLLFLGGCGKSQPDAPPQPPARAAERLLIAESAVPRDHPLIGEIATRDQAEARARIAGILVELDVREGDLVRRGQRVAMVVDSRVADERRARAANVAAARAEAERTGAELERTRILYGRGFVAKARLEQAQAAARSANAGLDAARAQEAASAATARQGAVLAPAAGRVLRADIPAGSAVTPGTSIATITAGPPCVRLDVPVALARQLRVGMAVAVRGDEGAGLRAGTLVQIYPAVDGGRVRVDAEVAGLSADLVGRPVAVVIRAGGRRAIIVPRRFVATRFGVDYAEIAEPRGVRTIAVQTAPVDDPASIEILSGVGPGDILLAQSGGQ